MSDLIEAQGIVEVVAQNKAKTMWSFKIGEDWFGAGKYRPKFNNGDEIKFSYDVNGDWKNMKFGSVTVLEQAPQTATPTTANSGGPVDWDAKDKRITFLACRKDALVLAGMIIDKEGVTIPTKKGDRAGAISDLVTELTCELYEQVYDEPFGA